MKVIIFSLLLMCSSCVSGNSAIGINVRNIDAECGKIPAPITVGTSLPSVIIQRNRGAYKRPCAVTLQVITDSFSEPQYKFYVKVVALNLPKTAGGECYHWLSIDGLDVPGVGVEMCGKLAELEESGFVSLGHDIDVHWNATNEYDPVLTKKGLNDGYFKVVITVFTEASPVLGCLDEDDPKRPEANVKYHQCSNNRCIDERLRCNRFNNCGDDEASDEENCDLDADNGILYIIIGIVMGGLSLTLILIYFLFYVDCDGDSDPIETGVETGVSGDEIQDDSVDEFVSALSEMDPDDRPEDRADRSKVLNGRPSAIMELDTIDEEIQDAS